MNLENSCQTRPNDERLTSVKTSPRVMRQAVLNLVAIYILFDVFKDPHAVNRIVNEVSFLCNYYFRSKHIYDATVVTS